MTTPLWPTVKAALKASNLTQQEIADRAQVSRPCVSFLLSGRTLEPTASTLERLAGVVGMEIVLRKRKKSS